MMGTAKKHCVGSVYIYTHLCYTGRQNIAFSLDKSRFLQRGDPALSPKHAYLNSPSNLGWSSDLCQRERKTVKWLHP